MAVETGILRPDQHEKFDRDGYLIFNPEIAAGVLNGVLEELEPLYKHERALEGGVQYMPGERPRIRDAWHINEDVKAIALAPKVLAVLEELYGRRPLCFQTLNFKMATQQDAHSDSIHFSPTTAQEMCGVWVALEDIDMDNGPLIYYPGSHRLPFLDYTDIDFPPESEYADHEEFRMDRNRRYIAHVAGLIDEHGFKPEYGTIKKGEALIWAANLLHGGAPQRDPGRTRHSQVSHYLFEGATGFYTAIVSGPDHRVWTEPQWVS
jgi:ectoine hydroxylase-related dioxygenase (phytanoyl-CoA dioxygenase family)